MVTLWSHQCPENGIYEVSERLSQKKEWLCYAILERCTLNQPQHLFLRTRGSGVRIPPGVPTENRLTIRVERFFLYSKRIFLYLSAPLVRHRIYPQYSLSVLRRGLGRRYCPYRKPAYCRQAVPDGDTKRRKYNLSPRWRRLCRTYGYYRCREEKGLFRLCSLQRVRPKQGSRQNDQPLS